MRCRGSFNELKIVARQGRAGSNPVAGASLRGGTGRRNASPLSPLIISLNTIREVPESIQRLLSGWCRVRLPDAGNCGSSAVRAPKKICSLFRPRNEKCIMVLKRGAEEVSTPFGDA